MPVGRLRLRSRRLCRRASAVFSFIIASLSLMAAVRLKLTRLSFANSFGGVPAVIHQMAAAEHRIPAAYTSHVTSWLSLHPRHEYRLWTNPVLRRLLEVRFPQSVNWTRSLLRSRLEFSDVSRYFLLLEYGGIYADMDVRVRRPLPEYLASLAQRLGGTDGACGCFLGREPQSHAVLLYGLESLPSNALMACQPGHEFMRFVIDRLPLHLAWLDYVGDSGISHEDRLRRKLGFHASRLTGPIMLHRLLRQYKRQPPCSWQSPSCGVCLMEPEYTMPYADPSQLDRMRSLCDTVAKQPARVPLARRFRVANFCREHSADIRSAAATAQKMIVAEHDFLHLAYTSATADADNERSSDRRNSRQWLNLSLLMTQFPDRIDLVRV